MLSIQEYSIERVEQEDALDKQNQQDFIKSAKNNKDQIIQWNYSGSETWL